MRAWEHWFLLYFTADIFEVSNRVQYRESTMYGEKRIKRRGSVKLLNLYPMISLFCQGERGNSTIVGAECPSIDFF